MKKSKIVYAACCSFLALSLIGCNPETPESESGSEQNQTETPSTPTTPETPAETPEQTPSEEEKTEEQETPTEEEEEETPSETEKEPENQDTSSETEKEEKPDVALDWEKFDYTTPKDSYGTTYVITVTDEAENTITDAYTISADKKTITLIGNKKGETAEPAIYTISGFLNGQIISEVKNNEIILNKAYIINENAPSIICKKKTQISFKEDTENYIISTGTDTDREKSAAIYCEGLDDKEESERKSVEFGGKGTCYVVGSIYHAVRANNVELKGSGKYIFQGTINGAGINCKSLSVKEDKKLTAYFVNSKNGIKADEFVEINSGTYYFGNLKTAIKTDTTADDTKDGKTPKEHYVNLYGNTFKYNSKNVEKWVSTDEKKYAIKETTVITKL